MQNIVSKINYIQERFAISNSYLANLLGYTPTCIRSIKSGRRVASTKFLTKLSNFFEIPIDVLMDDKKELVIETTDNLPINIRLMNIRINNGFTQSELSRAMKMPITTIASMEKRNRTPSLNVMKAYSSFFKIPLLELFIGSKN